MPRWEMPNWRIPPWKIPEVIVKKYLSGAILRGDPTGDRVYLTFDDGPDPEITPQVLEILRQADAQATFFVLASGKPLWEEMLRQIAQQGHLIALHGLNHGSGFWRSNDKIFADLMQLAGMISRAGVESAKIFRPPYGHVRPDTVRYLNKQGLTTVLWSRIPGDFRPEDGASLFRNAIRNLRPGSILALHDGTHLRPAPVLELTQRLLEYIQKQGWSAAALQLRPGIQPPDLGA